MIPLPYKIIAAMAAFIAITAAILGYGHRQFIKGGDIATAAANTKVDRQKIDAAALLAQETARANTAERALQDFKNNQELKDADHQKTVSDLAGRVLRSTTSTGRLRDPNAAPGCRLGSGGATAQGATAPGTGADNGAETSGLLSVQLSNLLRQLLREADDINAAYQSCRPYALKVSEPNTN